jgi:hypothetical protein
VAAYRCVSRDLLTGTLVAEIPLSGLSYSHRLNDVGELSASLFLPTPSDTAGRTLGAIYNDAVEETRRQLVIERDGVVVWCGIIWAAPYDDGSQSRSVRAASDWSYFRRRFIDYSSTYTGTDQFTIARQIVNAARGPVGLAGDIGVTVPVTTSGVTRDRTYTASELKPVAEAVEELAAVDNGFDFGIDCAYTSAGVLQKVLNFSYPRRGRNYLNTGHVFELGRNVISFSWPSDGTRVANKVFATGQGEGNETSTIEESGGGATSTRGAAGRTIGLAIDANSIRPLSAGGPGYPLLEKQIQLSDVTVQDTANRYAQAELAFSTSPIVLPEITVRGDRDPEIGTYIAGDACRLIIPAGMTPRFPDGLDTYYRIIEYQVMVDDNGTEEVKLVLGEEPRA